MGAADWHTFQVLTKRHERLADVAAELDWAVETRRTWGHHRQPAVR